MSKIILNTKEIPELKINDKTVYRIFKGGRVIHGDNIIWGQCVNLKDWFIEEPGITAKVTCKVDKEALDNLHWYYLDNKELNLDYIPFSAHANSLIETLNINIPYLNLFGGCRNIVTYRIIKFDKGITAIGTCYKTFNANYELQYLDLTGITKYLPIKTDSGSGIFSYLFDNDYKLQHIEGLSNFLKLIENNSTRYDASRMFCNCKLLTDDIDLTNLSITLSTTTLMFANCEKIKKIKMCNTITYGTTAGAFMNCNSLEYLDLTNFSAGSSFKDIFTGCDSLKDLYVTKKFFYKSNYTYDFSSCPLNRDSIYRLLNAANQFNSYHTIKLKSTCFNLVQSDEELSSIAEELINKNWSIAK